MKHFLKISTLFLLFIFLNVTSCKDDDEVPVDLLTVNADALYYSGSDAKNWIVLWNSKGDVLDYKEHVPSEAIKLSSTGEVIDNKVTLGFVSYVNDDGRDNLVVLVYTDIQVGQTINRDVLRIDTPIAQGPYPNYTINFEPSQPFNALFISNKYNYSCGLYSPSTTVTCQMDNLSNKYNIMIRDEAGLRHKVLENVQGESEINLTSEDFTPYENELTFDLPSTIPLLFLNGYEDDVPLSIGGYALDSYYATTPQTKITTGYLDGLTRFSIYLSTFDPDEPGRRSIYQKAGPLPGTINWPTQSQFSIGSKDQATFAVNTTQAVKYIWATWESQSTTSPTRWEVMSPSTSPKIGRLPDELLELYPFAQPEADDFQQVNVCIGPETYEQLLTRELLGNRKMEFERMLVGIY